MQQNALIGGGKVKNSLLKSIAGSIGRNKSGSTKETRPQKD